MARQTLHGLAAAPGTVSGAAYRYHLPDPSPTTRILDPTSERQRLATAITQADSTIAAHEAALQAADRSDEAEIFAAHRMLLTDPALYELAEQLITSEHCAAEVAMMQAAEQQAQELEAIEDEYLRARATDLRDIARQVRRALTGEQTLGEGLSAPAIVVAHDLGPSDLMSVPRERLLGFALAAGGLTAHASILARGLGIPAVVGLGPALLEAVPTGTAMVLDGSSGKVLIAPAAAELAEVQVQQAAAAEQEAALRAEVGLPAVTLDGHPIMLVANAATAAEAAAARSWGAEGIGLLRTELLFLERPDLPDEAEQLALYQAVAAELPGLPITVRTLDVGGDKHLPAFPLPREDNPFLGWRGIRIGLSQPELLLPQLRALLRTAATTPIRIMLPMISTVGEVRQARVLLEQAQSELEAAGLVYGTVELGIMIEVPAAALAAEQLARAADFFSIGTNDLTQYTLACDRGNSRVANLYQPLHPAVLNLIAMSCQAAHRHGRHVAVCGELGGNPQATALLIGLGVDELSCAPPALPRVRAAVRKTTASAARELASQALAAEDAEEVTALLAAFHN